MSVRGLLMLPSDQIINNRSRLNKSGHFGEFSSDRRHINRSNVEILRKGGVLNVPTRSATIWNANAMFILAKKKCGGRGKFLCKDRNNL